MILSCQNISKSFGTEDVLKHISFHIEDHEKAAIIGVNGAGKSTLLKIMVGEMQADEGQVIFSKGIKVGYLSQMATVTSGNTLYDEVLEAKKDVLLLADKISETETQMQQAKGKELDTLMERYARLTHDYEAANGYALRSEIVGVLTGLGFEEEDFQRKVDTLSGGQRTRVALGKLLLSQPDLILLDEPTNHLDMDSVAWLETFLKSYKGAVLIVAHDRYFLDRIVTKIIEIENHQSHVYEGNYTAYAQKKAQLRDAQRKAYEKQQMEIKHQEEVITKLKSFNREKSIKRAESREKKLAKMEILDKPTEINSSMRLVLTPSKISGQDVLLVDGLEKSFGDHPLFSDVAMDIKREEKVALIGKNGTGKTTILKIINGMLPADKGSVRLGAQVEIGYYDQEHHLLSPEKTIFQEISDTYPTLTNTRIRNVLAAFLFTGDDVFKTISELSGGEQGRVSLAKLMLSDANFLILDEPTNHLDITSREILEEAIQNYSGTVLYVSHDRYFINRTATRILDLTEGTLKNYPGNYDRYLEKKENPSINASAAIQSADTKNKGATTKKDEEQEVSKSDISSGKADYLRQKEAAAKERKRINDSNRIEKRINEIDLRTKELDQLLTQESVYTDAQKLLKINNEKTALEEEQMELLEKWDALNS